MLVFYSLSFNFQKSFVRRSTRLIIIIFIFQFCRLENVKICFYNHFQIIFAENLSSLFICSGEIESFYFISP